MQSTDPYGCNLVVCTEREKFLVPVLATGVMPELDLPGECWAMCVQGKVGTEPSECKQDGHRRDA
eukprot:1158035-Pelagomonas_calceolata.AAC.3